MASKGGIVLVWNVLSELESVYLEGWSSPLAFLPTRKVDEDAFMDFRVVSSVCCSGCLSIAQGLHSIFRWKYSSRAAEVDFLYILNLVRWLWATRVITRTQYTCVEIASFYSSISSTKWISCSSWGPRQLFLEYLHRAELERPPLKDTNYYLSSLNEGNTLLTVQVSLSMWSRYSFLK